MSKSLNYKIVKEIGNGSFGAVYLIKILDFNKEKSLMVLKKICLKNLSISEQRKSKKEINILSELKHPNIVTYKGCIFNNDEMCIFMGYCEGGDLSKLIKKQNNKLFPEKNIIRWFIQIVMALMYLHHKNIMHRDLKTQNIFLTKSGLIKVGDFGISRTLDSTADMAKSMVGTPLYMSPEILAGTEYNQKSDIWALGCCLFELLTLKHAFQAKDLGTLIVRITKGNVGQIPDCYNEELSQITRALLQFKPDNRPSASSILKTPFIRLQMESFLADTKQAERDCQETPSSSVNKKHRNEHDNVTPLSLVLDNTSPEFRIVTPLDTLATNESFVKYSGKKSYNDLSSIASEEEKTSETELSSMSKNLSLYSEHDSDSHFRLHSLPRQRRRNIRESASFNEDHEIYSSDEDASNSEVTSDYSSISDTECFHSAVSSSEIHDLNRVLDNSLRTKRPSLADEGCPVQITLQLRYINLVQEMEELVGKKLSDAIQNILLQGDWKEQYLHLQRLLGEEAFVKHYQLLWNLKLCLDIIA